MKSFFSSIGGRSTAFAVYFTIIGTVLQWFGKLDMQYIGLIAVVQALVLGHSVKEDYFAAKAAEAKASEVPPAPPVGGVNAG